MNATTPIATPEDEIAALRASPHAHAPRHRPRARGASPHPHPVLDHGFVRVVDYMGDDAAIVQAARVSYGAGTKHVQNDEGLIRYLMRHWHSTPFEMCEIKLHVKLPVFVARQWIRHRTANVNEYSARYSVLDREFYIPAPDHLAAQSTTNNQGRGATLEGAEAQRVLDTLRTDAHTAYDHYEAMLSQAAPDGTPQQGLARELARMNLPASVYTQWYWKTDLHNLFHFLRLRADPHAQYEIRVYAETIATLVRDWVPLAFAAFEDYRLGGAQLSAKGLDCVRRMLKGEEVTQETSGMSKGEWREFMGVVVSEKRSDLKKPCRKEARMTTMCPKCSRRQFRTPPSHIWYSERDASGAFSSPRLRNIEKGKTFSRRATIPFSTAMSRPIVIERDFYGRIDNYLGQFIPQVPTIPYRAGRCLVSRRISDDTAENGCRYD